jgi:hypothetical protein
VSAHAVNVSPCGGNPPLLLLSWTERLTDGSSQANEVTYNYEKQGDEYTLVRKHCINNKGTVVDKQTLARNLASTAGAAASCQPAACGPQSDSRVLVTLSLAEPPGQNEPVGRVYEIRGSTRTSG